MLPEQRPTAGQSHGCSPLRDVPPAGERPTAGEVRRSPCRATHHGGEQRPRAGQSHGVPRCVTTPPASQATRRANRTWSDRSRWECGESGSPLTYAHSHDDRGSPASGVRAGRKWSAYPRCRSAGATVLMANHDSAWDPLVVGCAAVPRRQVRALAKASLWKSRPLAWVLDRMGQVPIERGRADTAALAAAVSVLRDGGCVGVFPEGTVSRGRALRPLSGAGRLALALPDTRLVCAAVTGAVDIVRFPGGRGCASSSSHRPGDGRSRAKVRFHSLAG